MDNNSQKVSILNKRIGGKKTNVLFSVIKVLVIMAVIAFIGYYAFVVFFFSVLFG